MYVGEKVMSFLRGNWISMGRWSEPRVLIGFQEEESKRVCDAREISGEEYCASVLRVLLFGFCHLMVKKWIR